MAGKLESTERYRGKKISVFSEREQLPGGKIAEFDLVRHPGAVVILPIADSGELCVLRQYRPALGRFIDEFPAGTLEPNEDPAVCAARELEEEIGMQASQWQSLGTLYPAPGFCDEIQYCYLARGLSPKKRPMDEDEVLEPRYISVGEAERMIREGEISDGKSIALFFRARLFGFV